MKKSKKAKNTLVLSLITLVVAAAVFVMMFLPAVAYKDTDYTIVGSKIAFGGTIQAVGSLASSSVKLNFFALLAFLLPVIVAVIDLLVKILKSKLSKVTTLLLIVAFLVSVIGLFTILSITNVSVTVLGVEQVGKLGEGYKLGTGAIIGGVLAIVGLLVSSTDLVLQIKK